MFDDAETAVLLDYAGDMGSKLPCQKNEIHELSFKEAVLPIARLGGYLHLKNDALSGHQVVGNEYFQMKIGAKTIERSILTGHFSAWRRLIIQEQNDYRAGRH